MVCCGLICPRAQANSEWFMRTPRDACPGAQTCCASPMRTPARLANSRRTWSRRRTRKSKCVPSRWKVLSGEFHRRLTSLAIKLRKPDRVSRRGLFEPREDFPRLPTNLILWLCPWLLPRLCPWLFPRLFPWLFPWLYPWLYLWLFPWLWLFQSHYYLRTQPLESSLGRVPQAADFACNQTSQIGSCQSPRTV